MIYSNNKEKYDKILKYQKSEEIKKKYEMNEIFIPDSIQIKIDNNNKINEITKKLIEKNSLINNLELELEELEKNKPIKINSLSSLNKFLTYNIKKTELELKLEDEKDLRGNLFSKLLLINDCCLDEYYQITYDKEKVVKIDLSNKNLTEVYSLNFFPYLKEINLSSNQINSIKKIKELSKSKFLEKINLHYNKIEKIEGLENFKNLTELSLSLNKITKIENLDQLKKLNDLDLSYNKIETIENLNLKNKLKYFSISMKNVKYSSYSLKELQNITGYMNGVSFDKVRNLKETMELNSEIKQSYKNFIELNKDKSVAKIVNNTKIYNDIEFGI